MKIEQPSERWFWFEPTFHPGQSALLHKQPDNIYRIDLQLGPDADPDLEKLTAGFRNAVVPSLVLYAWFNQNMAASGMF